MTFSWFFGAWRTVGYVAASAGLIYLSVVIGLRLGERRTLAEMTVYDFAVAVALGAIIGRTATARSPSYVQGVAAVVSLLVLHGFLSWVRVRSSVARRLLDHRPVVLIRHGEIDHRALRRAHLTHDDLRTALREQGVGTLADVEFAVLEGRGAFSVVRTSERVDDALLPPEAVFTEPDPSDPPRRGLE